MYLKESRTKTNSRNLGESSRELYFSSFIACNTLSYKGRKKCGITEFTKICTNYVIDWEEITKADYKSYAWCEANLYGMVMVVATPYYEDHPATYIYDLGPIAKNVGLWEKIDKGYGRKDVHMLAKPDEIGEILTKGETFEGSYIKKFTHKEVGEAETLSIIYQHFEPDELNILCSHRDVNKSRACMEYEFMRWSNNFNKLIKLLDTNGPEDKIMRSIYNITHSCEQLEVKTGFILKGMPDVISKIENEVIPAVDRPEKAVLKTLHNRLVGESRAPYLNNDYVAVLTKQYKLNRGEIRPLNEALIDYYLENSYHGRDYNLQSFEMRDTINKNITYMNQKLEEDSKIDSGITQKEIKPNLEEIKKVYNELYRREYPLLEHFPQKR